jgi:hypothetical protein
MRRVDTPQLDAQTNSFPPSLVAYVTSNALAKSRLQCLSILHHRFDTERVIGSGKTLAFGLHTAHHGHGHPALGELGVNVQHLLGLFHGFCLGGMRRVSLLPQKLCGAEEQARAHLPPDHIRPLVHKKRQVSVTLNPSLVGFPDDGLRRGTHNQLLFKLGLGVYNDPFSVWVVFEPVVGDHGALLGESFNVGRLFTQVALRDEQRKIRIHVTGVLELAVEHLFHPLPNGETIGFDNHAPFHIAVLGEVGFDYNFIVPLGVVLVAGGQFGHDKLGTAFAMSMSMNGKNTPPLLGKPRLQPVANLHFQCTFPMLMNQKPLLLLLALPMLLASCTTALDVVGGRAVETDEFYLAGGEMHSGDATLEAARQQQLLDQYAEYTDEYNDGYSESAPSTNRSNGQLWSGYTSGYGSPFNSGYGNYGGNSGFGGYSAFNPLNTGFGSTYGYNNMAFMGGYDAWGNPIGGGFGQTGYGMGYGSGYGNGWGYDPFGGGYWGTPGAGYFGGSGYGYHPQFGSLGAYGNNWNGGCCGNISGTTGGGISTFTPPRPRPNLGQFDGFTGSTGGSGSGATDDTGGASTTPNAGVKPKPNQPGTQSRTKNRNRTRSRNAISLPASESSRERNDGRQSPAQETAPRQTTQPNRSNRGSNGNSSRSGELDRPSRNQTSPSSPRGGSQARPSSPPPSSPRQSAPRKSSGRSGRGG